ncbi:MAG TPA: methyltransferase domain-containing protein [Acetobacteraceae bacterium]|nr:methyltransferase domain-containing protein [Acetobacteraceae bacterium]
MGAAALYDRDYYVWKQDGWWASAAAIVPAVLRCFPARSVLDIGCNTGNLLATFARYGATDVLGLDGGHVPHDLMHIAPDQFRAADLETLRDVGRRFDIACSLEYAEHLPLSRAADFVALLVDAAPVVLFSAAVPGQGGLGHVNEQRQSWWAKLFAAHGMVPVDCVRPALQDAPGIEWYYAQNTLVYCPPERVPQGYAPVRNPLYLDLLDDRVFGPLTRPPDSIGGAVRALKRDATALMVSVRRRLTRGVRA